MKRYSQVRSVARRVRASMQYARWVERNRSTVCIRCGSSDDLKVHHLVELYHILLGLWKFYGEWEAVFHHAIAMHDDNRCEGVTLCDKCHGIIHPGRVVTITKENLHLADWCAVPRNLDIRFALGAKGRSKGKVGLLGFQTIFGLGWNIMNGYGNRIVDFNWWRFAELVGKKPSTSFCLGLGIALDSLVDAKVVNAWAKTGSDVEVHLTKEYVDALNENPWFVPLSDVRTSRMTVLVLRWLLSFQANRSSYVIGQDKLMNHMQITTRTPAFVHRCVKEVVKEISWVTVEEEGDNFRFKFKNRGIVPIHSLRASLFQTLAE